MPHIQHKVVLLVLRTVFVVCFWLLSFLQLKLWARIPLQTGDRSPAVSLYASTFTNALALHFKVKFDQLFGDTFNLLSVRGKIACHPHVKAFLCIARFQRRFIDNIGGLYRWFFASDTLVLTLKQMKYEPRRFAPNDKIVKVRLQDITVCDGIDALENLRIIGVAGNSRYQ